MNRAYSAACSGLFLFAGCFADAEVGALEAGTDSSGATPPGSSDATVTGPSGTTTAATTSPTMTGTSTSGGGDSTGDLQGCSGNDCKVDVLVIVDNSGTMAAEQAQIGRAMAGLEQGLRARELDVQVMFTTVDFGNPFCTPFQPARYSPSMGAPISTPCTDRLADFTGLGSPSEAVPEACTDVCRTPVAPSEDPFVAFDPEGDNVPDVTEVDVDGDGLADSAVAMAMACLGPQGINGCGYESPLENMWQALNPVAAWNQGDRPFMRPDATLAVVIVTDEADCSLADVSAMEDEMYREIPPDGSVPLAVSVKKVAA